jgi:hypothetical protein
MPNTEELDVLVKRALPYARKIQEVIGDTRREHLPVDDETRAKIAALAAVLKHAHFASHAISGDGPLQKMEWKASIDRIAEALVPVLAQQVSLKSD